MQHSVQPRPTTPTPTQERRLVPVLLLITFATGVVEAVTYFHLGHIFVAYVTGTIILFGAHLAGRMGGRQAAITPITGRAHAFQLAASIGCAGDPSASRYIIISSQ